MIIAIPKESAAGENRVALVPAHVASLISAGCTVHVQASAGKEAGYSDAQYEEKGAVIVSARKELLSGADVLLGVRALAANPEKGSSDVKLLKKQSTVIAMINPYERDASYSAAASRNIRAFALELMPRITRTQSMDVLSSMASIAGYRAVLLAAEYLPRLFPMMITAAGTIAPARVFIIGAGVAGLQAIATARRLGASVRAYDLRPAVQEQVESLGARFVSMELESQDSQDAGGYAKKMDETFYAKQRELMASQLEDCDVCITTAAIPGAKSPILITKKMLEGMHPGSVILDLAATRGGNCEATVLDQRIQYKGITIIGDGDLANSHAYHASQLFSKNISSFLHHLIKDGALTIDMDDEIVQNTLIQEEEKS